ncbi:hypothetical protein [Variovorax sp. dw_954]|nr:hypothetical protein [Variovorax sp. dw_954]
MAHQRDEDVEGLAGDLDRLAALHEQAFAGHQQDVAASKDRLFVTLHVA